jgi:hypothetical protein
MLTDFKAVKWVCSGDRQRFDDRKWERSSDGLAKALPGKWYLCGGSSYLLEPTALAPVSGGVFSRSDP